MKEKLEKFLKYLLVVVMGICSTPITDVFASPVNDTMVQDKSYSFWTATTQFDDLSDWVGAPEHPIKRTSDGAYVYCIASHIKFQDGQVVTGYTDESSQLTLSNLNRDELRRIKLYAYYGYGYSNHTSLDWFAATQYLIWEITEKVATPYPIADGGHSLERSTKYDAMMNEIRNLVDHHGDTVSFNNYEVTLKPGESTRLTDTNGVLSSRFEIPKSNDAVNFEIQGNDLIINAKKPFEGTIDLVAKENPNPPMVYDTTGQRCLSAGDPTYINGRIKVNVTTRFEFNKTLGNYNSGAYTPENKAEFELYNVATGELVATLTTNEDGEAFTYLRFGTYRLHQTKGTESYKFIKDYVFTINGSKMKEKATFNNEKIKSDLLFKKEDLSDGTPLPNTKIQIFDAKTDELVFEGVTDEDGQIIIKNLEYGDYYIIESEAPEGYKVNPEKMYFSITEDGKVVKATMKDEVIKSKVTLHKTDEDGNALAGVVFGLYDENDKLLGTYKTDENGNIELELKYGSYYFKELETIDGFKLNDEKIEFEVKEDGAHIEKSLVNVKVEKPKQPENPKQPNQPEQPKVVKVPNTSTTDSAILEVVGIIFICFGIGYMIYESKRKK